MNNDEPLFNQFEEDPLFDYELENEMLLMKLQAEFGGNPSIISVDGDDDLDAPLKYEFLKSVYEFEQNFHLPHPDITLFQHLDEPYLIDDKYLTDEGVSGQLQRIRRIMKEKQIMLDTIYTTSDRVVYKFILEELLQEKLEETLPPGFYRHYIYEEFHPNHERDIEEQTIQFFQQLAAQDIPDPCFYLNEEIVVGDILFTREEAVNRLMVFAGQFTSFDIVTLNLSSVDIQEDHALVFFFIGYNGILSTGEVMKVEQVGHIGFIQKDQLIWQIDSLDIPGVGF